MGYIERKVFSAAGVNRLILNALGEEGGRVLFSTSLEDFFLITSELANFDSRILVTFSNI